MPRMTFAEDRLLAYTPRGLFIKRGMDVALAAAALLFLAPLFAFVSLLILLEGGRPIFFRQERTGLNGIPFRIFKFRTMIVCRHRQDDEQTLPDDARITRLGTFLRRVSIDELPQLINVLTGEMSLVGPRPCAVVHDADFADANPAYNQRFRVPPGITGLAQMRGQRGAIFTEEQLAARLASDLEYINEWSLKLDIRILIISIGFLFQFHGA